ncbi:MAG: hypothetical protein MUO94_02230 [Thermoplasmata archaeon]|nr:hypothetical protein [Thermoplasmata archaeon]
MPASEHSAKQKGQCDIVGCSAEGERSVSGKKIEKAGMQLSKDPSRSARICKVHYKEFKKKTKTDRTLERLDW